MIAVIIAGGSGTRLWPLSTPAYPKHLLKINSEAESLLQKTYSRVRALADTVYVLTEQSHADHVRKQLSDMPDENFMVEPARRGTANCTAMALAKLREKHNKHEPVFVLWADHYIRDIEGFSHSIKLAATVSQMESRIVLIGIEPDYPATGFGYIQKGALFNKDNFVFNVKSFEEKPDYKKAKQYLKTGNHLWNCGYFIASIDTFEKSMKQYAPNMLANYNRLLEADNEQYSDVYVELESDNIDSALIEKVDDLLVVPANFDWIDLGSYGDLHKVTDRDECGNYKHGNTETDGVENSFIQNNEEKPLVVVGLDNIVVVNTPDGILVSRKDLSQKIGELSKRLQEKEKK